MTLKIMQKKKKHTNKEEKGMKIYYIYDVLSFTDNKNKIKRDC
jgi:hypothetical protein